MPNYFKKTLIWNGSIILGSFIIFGILLYLLGGKIESRGESIFQIRSSVFSKNKAAENLATLRQMAPIAEEYNKNINFLLPSEDDLFKFPDYFESLATARNLDVKFAFQGEPVKPSGGNPGYILFSFTVRGVFPDIRDFLEFIETKTTRFIIVVNSTDLVREDENNYALTGQGKVFFK